MPQQREAGFPVCLATKMLDHNLKLYILPTVSSSLSKDTNNLDWVDMSRQKKKKANKKQLKKQEQVAFIEAELMEKTDKHYNQNKK